MEEKQYEELRMPLDDDDKLATEVTIDGNKILSPNGYLIGKITQVDNGMLVEYVKKQPQYPKTYEECRKILGLKGEIPTTNMWYKMGLILDFYELIICRDAYWKIAGDWKPNWINPDNTYYTITIKCNEICKSQGHRHNTILVFPTVEMRDAFYNNFKDLIENCKKLL